MRLLPFLLVASLLASCGLLRPKPPQHDPVVRSSGLVVQEVVVPKKGAAARRGDEVTLHYEIRLEDGTVVDSSFDRGQPARFRLGEGVVPSGIEEGVLGMRRYGRRELVVPPALAYGADGLPGLVPPDATLEVVLELMDVTPGDEAAER